MSSDVTLLATFAKDIQVSISLSDKLLLFKEVILFFDAKAFILTFSVAIKFAVKGVIQFFNAIVFSLVVYLFQAGLTLIFCAAHL